MGSGTIFLILVLTTIMATAFGEEHPDVKKDSSEESDHHHKSHIAAESMEPIRSKPGSPNTQATSQQKPMVNPTRVVGNQSRKKLKVALSENSGKESETYEEDEYSDGDDDQEEQEMVRASAEAIARFPGQRPVKAHAVAIADQANQGVKAKVIARRSNHQHVAARRRHRARHAPSRDAKWKRLRDLLASLIDEEEDVNVAFEEKSDEETDGRGGPHHDAFANAHDHRGAFANDNDHHGAFANAQDHNGIGRRVGRGRAHKHDAAHRDPHGWNIHVTRKHPHAPVPSVVYGAPDPAYPAYVHGQEGSSRPPMLFVSVFRAPAPPSYVQPSFNHLRAPSNNLFANAFNRGSMNLSPEEEGFVSSFEHYEDGKLNTYNLPNRDDSSLYFPRNTIPFNRIPYN